jgi:hypothetical protein
MSVEVKREDGRVWIEDVPELGWGKDRECTFAGALEAALAVTDRATPYSDIMGYTGLAFRTRWYHGRTGDRWCPSSPVGEFPQEIEAIQQAIGWRFRTEILMSEDAPDMSRFRSDIVGSIDAGLPIPAYEPNLNMDVIYGYEDGGELLLLRDYAQEEPLSLELDDLGPFLIFLAEEEEVPMRVAAVAGGLAIGSANWECRPVGTSSGGYHYGMAAFQAWEQDLGFGLSLSGDAKELLFFVSWWNYSCLYDARKAAVAFLRSSEDGPGGEAMAEAADVYEQELDLLASAFENKDVFLGPWSGKTMQDWTEDVVVLEREILIDAMEMETEAIGHIRRAIGV